LLRQLRSSNLTYPNFLPSVRVASSPSKKAEKNHKTPLGGQQRELGSDEGIANLCVTSRSPSGSNKMSYVAKEDKEGVEGGYAAKSHKIRITLTSQKVKAVEKGALDTPSKPAANLELIWAIGGYSLH
jgi:hypothetical protein